MTDELQQRTIVNVLDLYSPIVGPLREHVREWRLPEGAGAQLLELLEGSPEAGEPILELLCGNDPIEKHLVWISDEVILQSAAGRWAGVLFTPAWWNVEIRFAESRSSNWSVHGLPPWQDNYRVVHFLHKVIALGNGICTTRVQERWLHGPTPNFYAAALRDLVSLPRSRRTAEFRAWPRLPLEVQRAVAFHCSPVVELDVDVDVDSGGDGLLDAMRANQCPRRLVVHSSWHDRELALALEATTCIEKLTICLDSGGDAFWRGRGDTLSAVGRNNGIRDFALRQDDPMSASPIKAFWRSIMKSPTIQSVDASDIAGDWRSGFEHEGHEGWGEVFCTFNYRKRRQCAKLVAKLIRTNPRITRLTYHPRTHDAHIMETRVIPIVQLNRFRPVVAAALDAPPEGGLAQDRSVSGLVGSPIVRDRPELLYYLLRAISGRLGESSAH